MSLTKTTYNSYRYDMPTYNGTQKTAQTATNTAQSNTSTSNSATTVTATNSQSERVSISSAARAAAANDTTKTTNGANENKTLDRFVAGFAKSGLSKEQAINAYNNYANLANQRNPNTTTPLATVSTTSQQSTTTQATNSNNNGNNTQPTENKVLDRFVSGFAKSGLSKEQAMAAYSTYAALANKQGTQSSPLT